MSTLFYKKKLLKKTLVKKKLQELKNFIIFLPNSNIKQNNFRINKAAFLKLYNIKTVPANALITSFNQKFVQKELSSILVFYNNIYLLESQSVILDTVNNYSKLTTCLLFYIKFLKILKIYSVKKN